MRTHLLAALAAITCISLSTAGYARGGGGHSGGSSHSSSSHVSSATSTHAPSSHVSTTSPGTGAKSQSVQVRGYTKKNGTYVAPAKRTTPDKSFANNYSTKGNINPYTGKAGTRVEPPKKH